MARKIIRRDAARRRAKIRKTRIPLLVVSAIQNLRNSNGSTPAKIVNYVTKVSDISKSTAKRRVSAALTRGLKYGVVKRNGGRYSLMDTDPGFPFKNEAKMRGGLSSVRNRKRSCPLQRRSISKKKRSRRAGDEPFSMIVRRPLLSARRRKRSKNPRGKSPSSPHQLSDMYCNPSYKDSTDSSAASTISRKSSTIDHRTSGSSQHEQQQ